MYNRKGVNRKGVTISIWIWIIIGIVIAAFVFASAQQNIQMLIIQLRNQQALEDFNSLFSVVEATCSMTKGTEKVKQISINDNVYAIYASPTDGPPVDSAPHYIENYNMTSGYNLCYQFQVEHDYNKYNCKKTACNITMTYMGTPPKGSKLERIARLSGESFNYKLNIVKMAKDDVMVTAQNVLK